MKLSNDCMSCGKCNDEALKNYISLAKKEAEEQGFIELMGHVDATYRTKQPSLVKLSELE